MYNEDFLIKILCEITDGAPWKHRNINPQAKKLVCTNRRIYLTLYGKTCLRGYVKRELFSYAHVNSVQEF